MAIVKLLLVLVSLYAHQHAATAPNARPPAEQLHEQSSLEHAITRYGPVLGKIVSFTWGIFEISVLLALSGYCPPGLARPIHNYLSASITSNPATFTALTPTFLAGTLLMLTGGLLRAHCFNTLGSRFTFELSIRPAHTLVTTGVYGVVRHPSYTGIMLLSGGWLLCLFDLRPWLTDACPSHLPTSLVSDGNGSDISCHAMVTSAFVCLSVTLLGLVYVGFSMRMDMEDAMLEKNFGEEWRKWAERVPYRLIPGVC